MLEAAKARVGREETAHRLADANNGLGSMTIKGGTLLSTVRRTDPGGIFGTPPRAVAPPEAHRKAAGTRP